MLRSIALGMKESPFMEEERSKSFSWAGWLSRKRNPLLQGVVATLFLLFFVFALHTSSGSSSADLSKSENGSSSLRGRAASIVPRVLPRQEELALFNRTTAQSLTQ